MEMNTQVYGNSMIPDVNPQLHVHCTCTSQSPEHYMYVHVCVYYVLLFLPVRLNTLNNDSLS